MSPSLPPTPPPLPRTRSRSRSPAFWLAAFLIADVLALAALHLHWRLDNSRAIRREEAAIRQRGEPLGLADLSRGYHSVADAQNAAIPLLELWESESPSFWKAFRNKERKLPERSEKHFDPDLPGMTGTKRPVSRDQTLDPSSKAAIERLLTETASHRQAVREALRRPQCRFPIPLEEGYRALLPHLSELKFEARLFYFESLLAAEHRDASQSLAALENAGRVAHLLEGEPTLISQLVRLSCCDLGLNGLERLMNQMALNPDQLERAEQILTRSQLGNVTEFAFRSERAATLGCMDLSPQEMAEFVESESSETSPNSNTSGTEKGIKLMRLLGLSDADRRFLPETYRRMIALSEEGTAESLDEIETLLADIRTTAKRFPPKMYSALFLPPLSHAASKFAGFEARRRAALAAAAVERQRMAPTGTLPSGIGDLPPLISAELRTDPFDGMPLRFRKLPRGFVVYSTGPDRTDHGGREKPTKGAATNFDLTFTVER